MYMKFVLYALGIVCLAACSETSASLPANSALTSIAPAATLDENVQPYTPGVDSRPAVAIAPPLRALTPDELAHEAIMAAELGDPNRVFHHRVHSKNLVAGGNGEAVGTFTPYIPNLAGMVANIGVQLNYHVTSGGNFFHTHSGACFEFGINYAGQDPTLFGYNWCVGNLPLGFINIGLVGLPNGILNTWGASGNGWLLAWDATMGTYKISLEEVLEPDGWHLLGYNWATKKFVDIMNNVGVTGTAVWGGTDIFEVHVTPGTSCAFDPTFPVGGHVVYDLKKQVMLNGKWQTLDHIAGVSSRTSIDCANISANADSAYTSPYFSGQYFAVPATSSFGQQHAGDWWLTQR